MQSRMLITKSPRHEDGGWEDVVAQDFGLDS